MRDAPSVSYPVGRSFWSGAILLVLFALGAVACVAWAWVLPSPGRLSIAALVVGAAGAWAAASWRNQAVGMLAWDGAAWTWSPANGSPSPGAVEPALDLQSAMLLRWRGEAVGPAWLWAERSGIPERWAALRRAVYSRARSEAPARTEPPTAAP